MLKPYLTIFAVLLASSEAHALNCADKFTGFFDREIISTPETPYRNKMNTLGAAVIADILDARELDPSSAIAINGFSGVGKCTRIPLDSPGMVGDLIQAELNITLIGLKQDKAAIWYLDDFKVNEMTGPQCGPVINHLKSLAMKELPSLPAYYEDGFYQLKLQSRFEPISRKLLITANERFLLTKTRLGIVFGGPKDQVGQEIFQICAFPTGFKYSGAR